MKSIALIKDSRGFFWIPALAGRGILALFTDRRGDYSLARPAARSRLCASLGISGSQFVGLKQVHGAEVARIKRLPAAAAAHGPQVIPERDALLTELSGVALSVLTADCLPVVLVAGQRCVGIAHAGWRGLAGGVLANAVAAMGLSHGCEPSRIDAFIGPGIRPCCYQVGTELRSYFPRGMRQRCGRWYLDLALAAEHQLAQAGLKRDRIYDTQICSACDPDFFSFRQGDDRSRMLSLVLRLG